MKGWHGGYSVGLADQQVMGSYLLGAIAA